MNTVEIINQLLRKKQIAGQEQLQYIEDAVHYILVKKIILDNEIEETEIYQELNKRTNQLVSSFVGRNEAVSFYLIGSKKENSISILYSEGGAIGTMLPSVYPDMESVRLDNEVFYRLAPDQLHSSAFVTGIPAFPDEQENAQPQMNYDILINAMKHKDFAIKVSMNRMDCLLVESRYQDLVAERTELSRTIEEDYNETDSKMESQTFQSGRTTNKNDGLNALLVNKQEGLSENTGESLTTGSTITTGKASKTTQYDRKQYDTLLETHMERYEAMCLSGGYETTIQLFAEDDSQLELLYRAFRSTAYGDVVEPYRIQTIAKGSPSLTRTVRGRNNNGKEHLLYGNLADFENLYTKEELSYFLTPFMKNQNGFGVYLEPRFLQNVTVHGEIQVGNLLAYERDTNIPLSINEQDINKHILVAGMTGSGKTNTIFSLLHQVNKPFLIIEPAKTEYRVLQSTVKDLRVYTLGKEHVSPFRMNVFQFNYKQIALQEHIDNLKIIFTAAFTMYASMPNILEQCLINIYTKKGWSLLDSRNIFCKEDVPDYYYPTLEDLYVEIDQYIDSLGYAREQNQNIRAALLTRIKSLMTGAKGFMLNTSHSMDIKELLSHPTVLELEGIADDSEKALVIGFIMLNIYEYWKSTLDGFVSGLKHTVVIEEAHRLFANIPNSENQEQANMRGKSVETLSNMLCEIRAYGQGFIIVDQVPTKLAPDVLKNTNTKIIHKLVSKDDCDYIAGAMSMTPKNMGTISKLKVGQAIIYNETLDGPAHVKIHFDKDKYHYVSNQELHKTCRDYNLAVFDQIHANPIVETLLNLQSVKEDYMEVVKTYIKVVFATKETSYLEAYTNLKKNCLSLAFQQGFQVEENLDEFVTELVNRISNILLNKSQYRNNLKQKHENLALIAKSMELAQNETMVTKKQLAAFTVRLQEMHLKIK